MMIARATSAFISSLSRSTEPLTYIRRKRRCDICERPQAISEFLKSRFLSTLRVFLQQFVAMSYDNSHDMGIIVIGIDCFR